MSVEINVKTLIKKSQGKINAGYINITDGKTIYIINKRTTEISEITFSLDEDGYNATLKCHGSNIKKTIKIYLDGKISILTFSSIISFYMKKNILYIIAADENQIFE